MAHAERYTGTSQSRHTTPLTPRQLEIIRLVSEGLTNQEIADRLGLSRRTVEVHRFNMMRRLQVRNVAQLLRQALAQRLIPGYGGRRTKPLSTGRRA